jgi:bisphosphoglycerate-dependent phosphoglycerate mutase
MIGQRFRMGIANNSISLKLQAASSAAVVPSKGNIMKIFDDCAMSHHTHTLSSVTEDGTKRVVCKTGSRWHTVVMTRQTRSLHTVVMIRHGESLWNVEKRFTGWCDVPLTHPGEEDAKDAGQLMKLRGLEFDVAFSSTLERAWRTLAIALSESGQSSVPTVRNWRLNERHYGALQGHLKNCDTLNQNFGKSEIIKYRRSWTVPPPPMGDAGVEEMLDAKSVARANEFLDQRYFKHETASGSWLSPEHKRTIHDMYVLCSTFFTLFLFDSLCLSLIDLLLLACII